MVRRIYILGLIWLVGIGLLGCKGLKEKDLERTLGKLVAGSLEFQYDTVGDPVLLDWVAERGKEAVSVCDRQDIGYKFKILDTEEINALACPGGYVYVTKGLLNFIESDDELMGIIGHEVGHVVKRHSWKQLKGSLLFNWLLSTVKDRKYGGVKEVAQWLGYFSMLRYSRKDEYEADKLGVSYAARADYDAGGMVDFLDKLREKFERRKPSPLELIFATHPALVDRIGRVNSYPELGSNNKELALREAESYSRRGLYKLAIPKYQKVLALEEGNVVAHRGLGAAYGRLGELGLAREEFERVLELAPEDEQVRAALKAIDKAMAEEVREPVSAEMLAEAGCVKAEAGVVIGEAGEAKERVKPKVKEVGRLVDLQYDYYERLSGEVLGLAQRYWGAGGSGISVLDEAVELTRELERPTTIMRLVVEQANWVLDKSVDVGNGTIQRIDRALEEGRGLAEVNRLGDRSNLESRVAIGEVSAAMVKLLGAVEQLRLAYDSYSWAVDRLVNLRVVGVGPEEEDLRAVSLGMVSDKLHRVHDLTQVALQMAKQAKGLLDAARARELANEFNLLAASVHPVGKKALAGIIGRRLRVGPEVVEELSGKGLLYSDIVLALYGADNTGKAVGELLFKGIDDARDLKVEVSNLGIVFWLISCDIRRGLVG